MGDLVSCLQMSMDHLLSAGYLVESGVSSSSFSTHLLTFSNNQQQSEQVAEEPTSTSSLRYSCKFCDYKTDKKSNHDSHIKFVHFKARDPCPECGKQIANLSQHLRVAHKIFKSSKAEQKCPMCDKQFLNLESHLQKAHNVKTQSEHVCSVCYKVFSKKDHLQRHEGLVHLGVKKICHICNKEFSNLEKHVKSKHSMESGSKPVLLSCDFCSQTFTKKSDLNAHNESVHAVQNPEKKILQHMQQVFCQPCSASKDRPQWGEKLQVSELSERFLRQSRTSAAPHQVLEDSGVQEGSYPSSLQIPL